MSKGIKNSLNLSQERTVGVITCANAAFSSQGNLVPLQQSLGIASSGHHALGDHHQGQCNFNQLRTPTACIQQGDCEGGEQVHLCPAWREVLRLAQEQGPSHLFIPIGGSLGQKPAPGKLPFAAIPLCQEEYFGPIQTCTPVYPLLTSIIR